ncbi:MAG: cephalosporin hydroxylase [Lysobacter sp.]|nr:cephalosporin hydroxylase [Lysobacter sp.]
MSADSEFSDSVTANISRLRQDAALKSQSMNWLVASAERRYSYNFRWMGRPIIQYPQDMIAMQEILWEVRPDLVIETGIAHGGSLVYYASLCQLIGHGEVLGVDIDIRPHNRKAIEAHPMASRIRMLEGSSIERSMIERVQAEAAGKRVLVVLDSNHTHAHVLAELQAYAPLVSVGSYCVVYDTVVEDMPPDAFPARPWGVGDNPKTAVHEFLAGDGRFEIDRDIEAKIQITVAPDGYLKRIR